MSGVRFQLQEVLIELDYIYQQLTKALSAAEHSLLLHQVTSAVAKVSQLLKMPNIINERILLNEIRSMALNIIKLCASLRKHRYEESSKISIGRIKSERASILKHWYTLHVDHPYPTELEKVELAKLSGLTIRQISMWFTNARRRSQKGQKFVAQEVSPALHALTSGCPGIHNSVPSISNKFKTT